MEIIKITKIKLSTKERDVLISAQKMWNEIREKIEDELITSDEIEEYFNNMNEGLNNILNIINDGIEQNE
jgi:hypothetical protein|uniref:Uncharacterized protein n=1 Tax=Siphoviridae sp. ctqPo10 TaxID=2827948 RepID=A0A8S5SW98_9CAUD|nr:MAG TPA: hypothetical protein [Siphoviridae sp. ctqPo10]